MLPLSSKIIPKKSYIFSFALNIFSFVLLNTPLKTFEIQGFIKSLKYNFHTDYAVAYMGTIKFPNLNFLFLSNPFLPSSSPYPTPIFLQDI